VNAKIRRQLERRKHRIHYRLNKTKLKNLDKPVFTASNIQYQIGDRLRPENIKEGIVRERAFKNIVLQSEDVAEMPYRPVACRKT
jgi:hypothetical protein